MSRLDEIKTTAADWGEPVAAMFRSALECLSKGRLDAAARIVADQVAKRPALRWLALLFAFEVVELELVGAVRINTPSHALGQKLFFEESWPSFIITTYPEGVQVQAQVTRKNGLLTLRSNHKAQAAYDPLVRVVLGKLLTQLSLCFGETVSLEKMPTR